MGLYGIAGNTGMKDGGLRKIWRNMKKHTIITLCIGEDRPLQTV